MTEAQAVEQILEAWDAGFTVSHPTVPWFADNESGVVGQSFARIATLHTVSQQVTMGPVGQRRWERRGQIMVQLFTPIDQGRAAMSGLADDVRSVLEGVTLTGELVIEAGRTQEMPADGSWNACVVVLTFRYYQTR